MIRGSQVLCCIMAVLLPVTMFAADVQSAMLSTSGTVMINGATAPRSALIMVGDRVTTTNEAGATLTTSGSVITLPASSEMSYAGSKVRLEHGRVVVKTSAGMRGSLGNLTITPAATSAQFQMTESNGKLVLTALKGSLNVSDGTNAATLEAGETISHGTGQEPAPPPPPSGKQRKGLPGWAWGALGAGAVGGILGGVLGATGGGATVSPHRP